MFNFLLFLKKFFKIYYEDEYSKFIIETKLKTSINNLINITYLLTCLIFIFSIFYGISFKNFFIFTIGLILAVFFPFLVTKLFNYIITGEMQQFDLDCSFILRDLIVISQTTRSETQAYFLLTLNSNHIIRNFGQNAFIEKNLNSSATSESIISQLDKIKKSSIIIYLKNIFSNWSNNEIILPSYTTNFQKLIQAKFDEDFRELENSTTILNALIGIFPILIIFLVFLGFKNVHPFFELSLLLFISLLLLILIIDPLRIKPILDFFGSKENIENFYGSTILQEFYNLAINNHNLGKSLQQLVLTQDINNSDVNVKDLISMNFIDFTDLNKRLISILTKEKGVKLQNIFNMIFELKKIDYNSVITQLPEIIANYSSIEHYYFKKYSFLSTERSKTFLIIILNSFSLGILSVLLPYLLLINTFNFSMISTLGFQSLITPKLEIFTSFEFMILVILVYIIYHTEYLINSSKIFYRNISINLVLFFIGFSFCLILLQPEIIFI